MPFDPSRGRELLAAFEIEALFIDELGWDRHASHLVTDVAGQRFSFRAIAEKRGLVVLIAEDEEIPDRKTRLAIERQVARLVHEHIVVFVDPGRRQQVWQWPRREPGQPTRHREFTFHGGQSGEDLIQRLARLAFALDEEADLTIVEVARRVRAAFDVERVTKRFYERFQAEHAAFLSFISGLDNEREREWYASVTLNRLMFVYFIQKKGFLANDGDYLRTRLSLVQEQHGLDRFFSFYRHFLLRLFHEGLGQRRRPSELDELLGSIPYLNGGLFDVHELERDHPTIDIPDEAFERLFDFFDAYQWHLDDRPLQKDNEINPDVLGYIFEQYINQKQMGAYYTKEDITQHMASAALGQALLRKIEGKENGFLAGGGPLEGQLKALPERYIREGLVHGVDRELPRNISAGEGNVSRRAAWDKPAPADWGLPNETWREHVERRRLVQQTLGRVNRGLQLPDDLVTLNLDLIQLLVDTVEASDDPAHVLACYEAVQEFSVLDPACGSGAFLFAALNVLEPIYDVCLERMAAMLESGNDVPALAGPLGSRFQRELNALDAHSSRRYFLLKTAVLNNLFGVDIMEEAVEICKLRLFLKLAAQLDRPEDVEPLPDIDLNIRSGNSLVGFVTVDEVREAIIGSVQQRLDVSSDLERIDKAASLAGQAYDAFREYQQEDETSDMTVGEAKRALQARLRDLADELDLYLASTYGVSAQSESESHQIKEWRASHKPFHWFVEFYSVMQRGGFDAVIGNPPYVEKRVVASDYTVRGYTTDSTNNLYAYMSERGMALLASDGTFGFIVPLSSMSTGKFGPLQEFILSNARVWLSSYDDRPARLFEGLEHIQLTIILATRVTESEDDVVHVTRARRWSAVERANLFETLRYASLRVTYLEGSVPKVSSPLEVSMLDKLFASNTSLGAYLEAGGPAIVYYTRKVHAFLNVLDFVPEIRDGAGKLREPSEQKTLMFRDDMSAHGALCTLNSTLFRWFLGVFSDCRNLNRREVLGFPIDLESLTAGHGEQLSTLAERLSESLRQTSEVRTMRFGSETLEVQCIIPRHSKAIIDEIDGVLAEHFHFSEEELDFIVSYDLKYRLS